VLSLKSVKFRCLLPSISSTSAVAENAAEQATASYPPMTTPTGAAPANGRHA